MGTRYEIGDSVRQKGSQGIYGEVVDIKNPESNSPDYIVKYGDDVSRTVKASDLVKATQRDGDIDASSTDSVSKATQELREKFEAFENKNERFHYNKTVVDQDGYKAAILVDFGVEDYETGGYYVGNVMATREDQPNQDAEDIAMSNAFYKAQEIVENAAVRGLTDMSRRDATWDNHEDGEHVDATLAIIFNESNL